MIRFYDTVLYVLGRKNLLLAFKDEYFRAFAVEIEAVEFGEVFVEIYDFVLIEQAQKIVETVDIQLTIVGFEMHGDNDVGHKFVDVFLCFLSIYRIISANGNKKDVCGNESLRKHRVALLSDIAEMAYLHAVQPVLKHEVFAAKSAVLPVVVGKQTADMNAFDFEKSLRIENNGIARYSGDEVMVLVIMT